MINFANNFNTRMSRLKVFIQTNIMNPMVTN